MDSDTVMVSDMATTTARGRLSPTTESTLLITLSTPLSSPATLRSPPLPPSPPSELPLLPSPPEEPTLVPDATLPTLPEPSMLPRGRLRPTPTTTEDTVLDTAVVSTDTEDTVSDTAVATTGARF